MKDFIYYNIKSAMYALTSLKVQDIASFEARHPECLVVELAESSLKGKGLQYLVRKLNNSVRSM